MATKIPARDQIATFRRSLDFTLAAGRTFNRQVLPYLRLFWPGLREVDPNTPESGLGIDFIARRPAGRIQCAVCCRAFKGGKPGLPQMAAAIESIDALRDTNLHCEVLVLVHNANAGEVEFKDRIASALSGLVAAGKARVPEIWDRQTLANRASQRLAEFLEAAFRKNSTELLYRQQSLFRFGSVYLPRIPVIDPEVRRKALRRSSRKSKGSSGTEDISSILRSRPSGTWTVLAGADGAGKTAAVLHAARSMDKVVLLVPSAALSVLEARHNVTRFLEDLVRCLDVFRGFEDVHDQEMLYRLAGPVLAQCLEREKSPYLLVVDGLDENRPATDREKLERLIQHLSGLRCQVVLTTADAVPAKFAGTLKEFAAAKDQPRRFSLGPWTKRQMVELVSEALRTATGDERQHLAEFLVLLQNDRFLSVYGNLPSYPLFLHMILEEVAESGVKPSNQTRLLRSWVGRRVQRAFASRDALAPTFGLLEDIAGRMVSENAGSFEMAETLSQATIRALTNRHFPAGDNSFTPLLSGSVLLSHPSGRNANFNVGFAFDTVQAYFTARYLVREHLPATGYPVSVQSLHQELLASGL